MARKKPEIHIPPPTEHRVIEIPLTIITSSPFQPRTSFGEVGMAELAESIKEHGVRQPITVREGTTKGTYELISGERRLRASELAQKATIPAMVIEATDEQAHELSLIENLQREDLNPMDEARALQALITLYNGNESKVTRVVSKSITYVMQRIALLKLTSESQTALNEGKINKAQAQVLAEITDTKKQKQSLTLATRLNLTANELAGRTQHLRGRKNKGTKKAMTLKRLTSNVITLFDSIEAFDSASLIGEEKENLAGQVRSLIDALTEFETELK